MNPSSFCFPEPILELGKVRLGARALGLCQNFLRHRRKNNQSPKEDFLSLLCTHQKDTRQAGSTPAGARGGALGSLSSLHGESPVSVLFAVIGYHIRSFPNDRDLGRHPFPTTSGGSFGFAYDFRGTSRGWPGSAEPSMTKLGLFKVGLLFWVLAILPCWWSCQWGSLALAAWGFRPEGRVVPIFIASVVLVDFIQVSGPRGHRSAHGWLPTGIETLESVRPIAEVSPTTVRRTIARIEESPGTEVPRSQQLTSQIH